MKIAVTSQNFRTITQHAGKTRRFLIYELNSSDGNMQEIARLDLPKEMSMHEFRGEAHPIFEMDYLITASSGQGFIQRLARAGVKVIVTGEQNPLTAVQAVKEGEPLAPPKPHNHGHQQSTAMPSL
jgi:predicted Fe-Mo cluster-binding NifX family protein